MFEDNSEYVLPTCWLYADILHNNNNNNKKKHDSEGQAKVIFFIQDLIFETFKNSLYLAGSHRETTRTLARKININPITWIFKNMFLKYRKFGMKTLFKNIHNQKKIK